MQKMVAIKTSYHERINMSHTESPVKTFTDERKRKSVFSCSTLNKDKRLCSDDVGECIEHAYSMTSIPLVRAQAAMVHRQIFSKVEASLPIQDLKCSFNKAVSLDEVADIVVSCKPLRKIIEDKLLLEVDSMCDKLCSHSQAPGPSILRSSVLASSKCESDTISNTVLELDRSNKFLFEMLKTLCSPLHNSKPSALATVAMIYAAGMHCRNSDLSVMQQLNTSAIIHCQRTNHLLGIMNKPNLCLNPGSKLSFLDKAAAHNMSGIIKAVQCGREGKVTMDNIDGQWFASEYRAKQVYTKDFHYTASTYLPDRWVYDICDHHYNPR